MELQAALAAIALIEKLIPIIADKVKSGEVSPDEQAALHAKYEALRTSNAFSGPEWKVEPA